MERDCNAPPKRLKCATYRDFNMWLCDGRLLKPLWALERVWQTFFWVRSIGIDETRKRILLPVTYFPSNLVPYFPTNLFTLRVTGMIIKMSSFVLFHWKVQ